MFYRTTRGIEPTEKASLLYNYVKKAVDIICCGELKLNDTSDLIIGTIKIGVPTNICVAVVSDCIKTFHDKYPLVKIELVSKLLDDMILMLENRELDFIVDFLNISSKKFNIEKKYLGTLTMCLAGRKDKFPNIESESFDIEDLETYPLIIPRENSEMRNQLELFAFENDIIIEPTIEVSTQLLMQSLVEKGIGIGYFIKESIVDFLNDENVVIVNLNKELPKMKVNIAYIPNFLNNVADVFLKDVCNVNNFIINKK